MSHDHAQQAPRDPKALSDAELLALSDREPALFEELVSRYQRLFLRKAMNILRDQDDASDVVQEAFVRIYSAAKRFRAVQGATFSSWAYTILVNQCYTLYHKRQRHAYVSFDLEPDLLEVIPDQAGLESLEQKLTRESLVAAISRLPVLLRRAVEGHFIQGLPQQAVAEQEGVSNAVIRGRIHRAKRELRKMHLAYELV